MRLYPKLFFSQGAVKLLRHHCSLERWTNFFDALNVTSYTKGIKARKPFQKPYFNEDDPRLEVCISACAYVIYYTVVPTH